MSLWNQEIYYYNTKLDFEAEKLAKRLSRMLKEEKERKGKTGVAHPVHRDGRLHGDSLGPLIGYKLKEMNTVNFTIFGTLDRPVHAMNLDEYVNILQRFYRNDLVVAVDASVGHKEHIGYVTLGKGALKPGLGVSKELRAVGDIFITGIVGSCGNYDPLMLQSVRLSVVMNLADCISSSIYLVEKLWRNAALI